jgi:hypothetical protein
MFAARTIDVTKPRFLELLTSEFYFYDTNIMQRQLIQSGVLFLALTLGLSACFTEPDFSNTPVIRFQQIYKITKPASADRRTPKRDSVVITIDGEDGDGDLGEDIQLDSARIRRTVFAKETWGNYELRTFQLVNGKYEELILADYQKLFFPRLYRNDKRGPIEITSLDFGSVFPYPNNFRLVTVKFRLKIRDRALRESNTIETDTITVPIFGR